MQLSQGTSRDRSQTPKGCNHGIHGVPFLKGQVPTVMFGSRWVTPQIPVPSRTHHDKVLNTLGPVTTLVAQPLTLRRHHLQAEPSEPLETLPLFPRQEQSLVFFGDSFFHPKDFPVPQAAVHTVCFFACWVCVRLGPGIVVKPNAILRCSFSLPAISGPK